ncbi:MAG: phosphatidate cytidylyltransferase [Clostridia bacterium]|nr:phosphatidate cytidylyltransferase [Clostridia bacterium]
MKTRVISGIVAAIIGIGAVVLMLTPVYSIFIAFLSAVATYEIMNVAQIKSKLIMTPAIVLSAIMPNYFEYKSMLPFEIPEDAFLALYVMLMLAFMLKVHKNTRFEQVAVALYASIFVPYAFSSLVTLRDIHVNYEDVYTKKETVYIILFALFCAFLTDTFAYFVGVKFGKHKMAPVVSPKKSVEGAIGGLVLSSAFNIAVFAGVREWVFGGESAFSFAFIIIMSVVLSAVSMLGDLSASLLKRNFGIKDFGNIMPGHGGIMDRFDSLIFVAPVLAAAIKFVNM